MRKCISFKKKEEHLFLHLMSKRNASDYIKDLIEADISKTEVKAVKEEVEREEITW